MAFYSAATGFARASASAKHAGVKTADFSFDLPTESIAQHPVSPRDAARLLVVAEQFRDCGVRDLPDLLSPDDLLVFNNTKVIPSRLVGHRGAAKVEVTLHKKDSSTLWRAFARPGRKLKEGDRISFADGLTGEVAQKLEGGEICLAFNRADQELLSLLQVQGVMPLPPYIRRGESGDPSDKADYQTIFAKEPGAVAAPTSGLHFTPELMAAIEARGLRSVELTLHVGAGTFLPVKTEDPRSHRMHSEYGHLSQPAAQAINAARRDGGRVVAVGTTALRLLETAADGNGEVHPFRGETDIYILPGTRFKVVDLLLTNFHLPRSTLFMLVCAFSGRRRMLQAYSHAKKAGYRFYSYGDACLLWPESAT